MARKLRTERRAPESKPARNKGAKALKDTAQVDLLLELRQAYPGIFDECRDALVWPGWVTLVRELAAELASSAPDARVDQIKSKFGELRAYTSAIKTQSLVGPYIERSRTICELCGTTEGVRQVRVPAQGRPAWLWTICPTCEAEL